MKKGGRQTLKCIDGPLQKASIKLSFGLERTMTVNVGSQTGYYEKRNTGDAIGHCALFWVPVQQGVTA